MFKLEVFVMKTQYFRNYRYILKLCSTKSLLRKYLLYNENIHNENLKYVLPIYFLHIFELLINVLFFIKHGRLREITENYEKKSIW